MTQRSSSDDTSTCAATAQPSSTRSRIVSLEPARTEGSDSVNETEGLVKRFDPTKALQDVNLSIAHGTILEVLGHSGTAAQPSRTSDNDISRVHGSSTRI